MPDESDKTDVCNAISETINEIELLLLKNVDDTQVLEHSLAEFTMKPALQPIEPKIEQPQEQHIYA